MSENNNHETKERIRKKLSYIGSLPSIPKIISEVSNLFNNDRISAIDLCKVISKDQAIVAKILAVANSPLYGLPRRVSTIEFAVVIIGFEQIKNILVALSLVEVFKNNRSNVNWDHQAYWIHSLLTATAAKRIADDLHYQKSGEVFTVGLLHDLGLAVLQYYMNSDFNKICRVVKQNQLSFFCAEKELLGFTHQEIAGVLFEKWNFPQYVIDAVLHHHNPSQSFNGKVLPSLVHLADYMTQKLELGAFNWDDGYDFDENVIDILGFGSMENLNDFIASYQPLFENHIEFLIEKK